jgi:Raf kinase inhibitor-like YbhB/YbcL family protein
MKHRIAVALLIATSVAAAARAADFQLTSPDVGPGKPFPQEFVYNAFGCTGGNQSFPLAWSGAPEGTKSFAIAHFDPDALRGRGFWHWFVVDIPSSVASLPKDAGNADGSKLPAGARQLTTSFRRAAYGGSCPPAGEKPHNYVVTVYALKVEKLDLPADATAAQALPIVEKSALGKATLTYQYGR